MWSQDLWIQSTIARMPATYLLIVWLMFVPHISLYSNDTQYYQLITFLSHSDRSFQFLVDHIRRVPGEVNGTDIAAGPSGARVLLSGSFGSI